ncbi:class I SAM-dependent DNA methyltransferase [Pseudalkalibacillus hwajinpoensis]|uniref:Class I SAM-dependent methyltransferase n=1 Tax=Guptibacillus hwajinpoensis TaxID=208199 RepID=A0A4U1MIA4_9BACL|nr:class I SAM-dependent methyltransferase [Pseudalkalibacillus hwajinpoensis]TKD70196.1 class I SAM-dependent methyltransferase [Pseudalkalibacillus hwajinpoensis]
MHSYERFSYVYDRLMEHAPYNDWAQLVKNEMSSGNVLDLGSGTGECSLRLAESGFNVTAVDLSEHMLSVAQDKAMQKKLSLKFLHQDMRELETGEMYDVITIFCDSLNYITDIDGVKEVLRRVYDHLKPQGILLFDVHSLHKIKEFIGQTFASNEEEISYIWNSFAGEEQGSVEHELSFFLENEEGLYERFDELHLQRTFQIADYKTWLTEVGFEIISIKADFTEQSPTEDSERIFFRAIKPQKG